jgi:HEPN domain-containing protein
MGKGRKYMENELVWLETARGHLRSAKNNLNIKEYYIAYQEAIWCGESLLKAVLVKNCKFAASDWHHNIAKLLKKIRAEQCIGPEMINQIEDIVENRGFGYIDVTSEGGSHMDCPAAEAPKIRYPINGCPPHELFGYNDASEKIEQAEQLLEIVSQLLSC